MTAVPAWISILSDSGIAALSTFISPGTLFTFDLDGTLAPIVDDPDGILIPEDIHTKIVRLCTLASVAVLTGRSCSDARAHLGFEPRFIIGNHGAEGLPGWENRQRDFVRLCRRWEEQLKRLIPGAAGMGVRIENKGASLTLHYRSAASRDTALAEIRQAVQQLTPLPRRMSGKLSVNIVPPDSLNKGEALLYLMHHAGTHRAVFIGDDVTDEDVFRLKHKDILGIRVGNHSSSDADFCLSDQNQIGRLLAGIIMILERVTP